MEDEQTTTGSKLAALRRLMRKDENDVQTYIVPSGDQHSSEYTADCDGRRAFISNFTGSAGIAVITLGQANLFTDGRYFLQASQQLDSNWTLQKQGIKDVPTWQEYLEKKIPHPNRVGVDPRLLPAPEAESLSTKLKMKGSSLVPLSANLVDEVWGSSRPPRPASRVFALTNDYTGRSVEEKLKEIREKLKELDAYAVVVSMLDEVAWLFNLRGSDIAYNPVFFAYAIVSRTDATLFINEEQLDESARAYIKDLASIKPYEDILAHAASLSDARVPISWSVSDSAIEQKILISKLASWALLKAIGEEEISIASPVADAKAIKNDVEIEGFRHCHIRDGAALAQYFSWLEEQIAQGVELTEYQAAEKLEGFRSKLDLYRGLSFTTISSTGPNCAIIHYSPDPKESAAIKRDQIYLCDSGAQYLDGTTDVTRTWHFGTPSSEEIRAFTRVLQGHIAIDTCVFPQGLSILLRDAFARRALWKEGLDYRHGTGHGVGHFLNVHEGPQGVGTRIAYNETPLKAGMTLSNEPGYYEDGKFGIRIENVGVVKPAQTPNQFDERGYLTFEHFTMCPIQTKLVDVSLLTSEEKEWLNAYHSEVYEKVSPSLQKIGEALAIEWLKKECAAI
ncbi:Creatinase aminopeptidase [Cantharellus anzutake]|uniref:Creatinase aminopeptidase n=1 Tax=Cantharellus anzutake TaxID=1750568 RepID=UPI001906D395|nr:Creatinase aminopeptidase [Cantharellus anzutake]KAF8329426.1 Creatinase aminopeptidase [Cantharellus anzutake]